MKKNILYYAINILFFAISLLFLIRKGFPLIDFNVWQILILLLIFIFIHLFKFIRIYFLLMEEMIPIKSMIKMYIKSTFVNILLPFKSGELFKLYLYGNAINNYFMSFFAIVIDKFLDSVVIIFAFLLYFIIFGFKFYPLFVCLLLFVVIFILFLLGFKQSYSYLNFFFTTKSNSKNSVLCLKFLDKCNNMFNDIKHMLSGRFFILLFLTLCSWIFEILFVYLMSLFLNVDWTFKLIINYLNDSFLGISNLFFDKSIYFCSFLFLILLIVIYFSKLIKLINRKVKGE